MTPKERLAELRKRVEANGPGVDYPDDPADHDEALQRALWELQLRSIASLEEE